MHSLLPLVGSQYLDVDLHSWKSTLALIIALLEQHYNNLKQSPGSSVKKMDNFLDSRRWLGIFKFYMEMGLESANFIG
jgi:hypothetical protein